MIHLIKLKALIMKKFILILIASVGISFYLSAQSAGDYRSLGNGNWNVASNWERYNGNSWVSTSTYPGQNSGTGAVTIMKETAINITVSVLYPISSLFISIDNPTIITKGVLTFDAENAVTLSVAGDIVIGGELRIEDQSGAKTHTLVIGHNLDVLDFFDDNCVCYVTSFQTMNQDDKLGVIFNSTDPASTISNPSSLYITFHDITFNCADMMVNTNIAIAGNATFINGIVRSGMKTATNGSDILGVYDIGFLDGSSVTGGSNVSYIEGAASKSGVDTFKFPMGHEGFYAPITISGIVQPELFFASYSRNVLPAQLTITDPEIFSISSCEAWSVIRDIYNPVNTSINVTVDWTAATRCGSSSYIVNASDVVLTNGSSHGGSGTGTTTNGSVTWIGYGYNLSDDGGFLTLGNVGTDCKIPLALNTTNITSNSATLNWSAVSGAVSYDVEYTTNPLSSWIAGATGTASTSVNLSGLTPSVMYTWRVRANCGSASSLYGQKYFLTLQAPPPPPPPVCNDVYESNNSSGQAKAISFGNTIFANISSTSDVDWFKVATPNNSNTNLEVTISNLPADYDLYVYNKNLQLVGSSATTGTSNEVVMYNSNARKTTYYIKVVGKNGAYNTSQCYNLLAQVSSIALSASGKSYPANEVTDISDKQLLYPNPASEFVHLRFNSTLESLVNVQIFNTAGQLIKQTAIKIYKGFNQVKIAVIDIEAGMYLLRINKGELNMTKKFVVAR
jgi:hypothetical protein